MILVSAKYIREGGIIPKGYGVSYFDNSADMVVCFLFPINHIEENIKQRGIKMEKISEFEKELESLINRHSMENPSNTPDFILAQYLASCMASFNTAIQQRENWYGRDPRPTEINIK